MVFELRLLFLCFTFRLVPGNLEFLLQLSASFVKILPELHPFFGETTQHLLMVISEGSHFRLENINDILCL